MATGMVILLGILLLADSHINNGGKTVQLSTALRRFRHGGTNNLRTDP